MYAVFFIAPFFLVLTLAAGIDLYHNYRKTRHRQKTQKSLSRSLRLVVDTMGSVPEIPQSSVAG